MKLAHQVRLAVLKWAARGVVTERDLRKVRLLHALGYDPSLHTATSTAKGVQVLKGGKAVAFFTAKALKRKRNDTEFLRRWEEAGT